MPKWSFPGVRAPEPGHAVRVAVDGTRVAVFNSGGRFFALNAACTHVGGPLDRGPVSGNTVTCPLHGSQFDLVTGRVVRGPATQPVRAYRVSIGADALVLESE